MKITQIFIIAILGNQAYIISAIKSTLLQNLSHFKSDIDHLHEGLPDKTWFLEQIFFKYSNQNTSFITQNDFKDIVEKLNINYHDHDDHDHVHSLEKSKSNNFSIVRIELKKTFFFK